MSNYSPSKPLRVLTVNIHKGYNDLGYADAAEMQRKSTAARRQAARSRQLMAYP